QSQPSGESELLEESELSGESESSSESEPSEATATAQAPKNESNYLLMVQLYNTGDPQITRILSVPPSLTCDKFHTVLQVAFGWTESHAHASRLDEIPANKCSRYPKPPLLYLQPEPRSSGLGFSGNGGTDPLDEADFSLADLLEKKRYKVTTRLRYEYDMGDGWERIILLLGRGDEGVSRAIEPKGGGQQILCVSGEGVLCAEDCGGPGGWDDLKRVFRERGGEEEKERRDWYRHAYANGDAKSLDPYEWDILKLNKRLKKVCA
ncbi:MAG: hypothetical protein Q9194_004304, partial [Teloschistes cf. exilis]